ncbi:hypothetical protein VTJ83DRAFT_112 [Remersonia thermophila]|uniref:Cellobiose dehydrogenase-like cytochrome domain-containing protein n=1 Tax=Remersonia thermophila TaxID=72144 RepID=A0ABR4DLN3_9PEZI
MESHPVLNRLALLLTLVASVPTQGVGASPGVAQTGLSKRQSTVTRYCDNTQTPGLCYMESWHSVMPPPASIQPSTLVVRIAVPDGVSQGSPFQTVLQMVMPSYVKWAGFAWGGSMLNNPLMVFWWYNQTQPMVSSRWTSTRVSPGVYNDATYRILHTSQNASHWTAEVVCSGCSHWNGTSLKYNDSNAFKWALGVFDVVNPESLDTKTSYHNKVGVFSGNLSLARVPSDVFKKHIGEGGSPTPTPTTSWRVFPTFVPYPTSSP